MIEFQKMKFPPTKSRTVSTQLTGTNHLQTNLRIKKHTWNSYESQQTNKDTHKMPRKNFRSQDMQEQNSKLLNIILKHIKTTKKTELLHFSCQVAEEAVLLYHLGTLTWQKDGGHPLPGGVVKHAGPLVSWKIHQFINDVSIWTSIYRGFSIATYCYLWLPQGNGHDHPKYVWNMLWSDFEIWNQQSEIRFYVDLEWITGWWFQPTPLKNDGVRQLGLFFPIWRESH